MWALCLNQIVPSWLDHSSCIVNFGYNLSKPSDIVLAEECDSLWWFELLLRLTRSHVQEFPFLHVGSFHIWLWNRLLLRLAHALLQLGVLKTVSDGVITHKVVFTDHYWFLIWTNYPVSLRVFLKFELHIFVVHLDTRVRSWVKVWPTDVSLSARVYLLFILNYWLQIFTRAPLEALWINSLHIFVERMWMIDYLVCWIL